MISDRDERIYRLLKGDAVEELKKNGGDIKVPRILSKKKVSREEAIIYNSQNTWDVLHAIEKELDFEGGELEMLYPTAKIWLVKLLVGIKKTKKNLENKASRI